MIQIDIKNKETAEVFSYSFDENVYTTDLMTRNISEVFAIYHFFSDITTIKNSTLKLAHIKLREGKPEKWEASVLLDDTEIYHFDELTQYSYNVTPAKEISSEKYKEALTLGSES